MVLCSRPATLSALSVCNLIVYIQIWTSAELYQHVYIGDEDVDIIVLYCSESSYKLALGIIIPSLCVCTSHTSSGSQDDLTSLLNRLCRVGARVAQWLEALTGNHRIESSNPTGAIKN